MSNGGRHHKVKPLYIAGAALAFLAAFLVDELLGAADCNPCKPPPSENPLSLFLVVLGIALAVAGIWTREAHSRDTSS